MAVARKTTVPKYLRFKLQLEFLIAMGFSVRRNNKQKFYLASTDGTQLTMAHADPHDAIAEGQAKFS
jgi:hypothetical protein